MLYDTRDSAAVRNWVVATTAFAWLALILRPETASNTHVMQGGPISGNMFVAMNSPARLASDWAFMMVAMMAPVLIQPLQFIRSSSLLHRRTRSSILFVYGYAAVWAFVGSILMSAAICSARFGFRPDAVAITSLAGAVVWQCSPAKQMCLNRCHVLPNLAKFGRAADRDAFVFGLTHGVSCAGSCWAWMLCTILLPACHTAAMAIAAILIFCERLERPALPRWQLRGFGRKSRAVFAQIHWTRSEAQF